MTVIALPESDDDLFDCASWYEDRRRGLGVQLVQSYHSTIQAVVSNPRLFGRTPRSLPGYETRIAPIPRFRHFVTYLIIGDNLVILSVDRGRRDGDVWRDRLMKQFQSPGDSS